MKTYPFTQEGLNDFLHDLYRSSIRLQIKEQDRILECIQGWIPYRFHLSSPQLDYLDSLDEGFMDDLAQQIAYAINHQLPITLDKKTDAATTARAERDSVKVTAYEAWQKGQASAEEEVPDPDRANLSASPEAQLIIRIFYRSP